MASASRLGSSLRLLSQQASALVGPSTASRTLTTSAIASAAAKKPASVKKKAVVKKKATHSGPRSSGGRRKGGADSTTGLSKTSEFHVDAPDMSHLPFLHAESLTSTSAGQTFAFSDQTLAAFKAFGLPQELERDLASQPKPRSLVRQQTLDLLDKLDAASKGKKGLSVVLDGQRGSGKSTLLAQSIAYALDDGWVVVSVPRAINLVNSSTMYSYSAGHKAYLQPEATKALLEATLKVNGGALKGIKTTVAVDVDGSKVEAGTSLEALLKRGIDEAASASARQTILETLFTTLATQTEVPVLIAVDDAQALFRTSLYKDPDFINLESFELGLPRALLTLLTTPTLTRGAIISALSTTHTEFPTPPELTLALSPSTRPITQAINAYTKLHPQHLEHARLAAKYAEKIDTSQPLSRSEAAAIFAQLKDERRHWSAVNDELFMEKLVESNGNARIFSRSLVSTLL
ncbi:Ribosomal protein S23/S29, mitochondrial [Kalmanozyma brasiliensis GHG001]|uniref:Small ribosomal subunit protein mS29 n=1 Tax=Kalmanozyma brasiliensis (strain GHG001) TaxID=1365824 RepID=V5EL53_KALBG|nr:Ribosomal protein S23/S29, mitochondrial [Kalmanozyma brasiliensis GHG001]EST05755.1 Ribosomal protein S23/S29, mitochondrial [Kalmanozyma brasiliensis GHG001]